MPSSTPAAAAGHRVRRLLQRLDAAGHLDGLESHGGNFEFASVEWCDAVQKTGCAMLNEAASKGDLDLGKYEWGFSEEYCNTPQRLMAGRERAVFWFMIHGGKVCYSKSV